MEPSMVGYNYFTAFGGGQKQENHPQIWSQPDVRSEFQACWAAQSTLSQKTAQIVETAQQVTVPAM